MSPAGRGSYLNDRKRIPNDELVIQKYLYMMQTVLLELYAGEYVDIGYMPVQFLEFKLNVRLGHQLHLLHPKDSGCLAKFAESSAPTGPETKL